MPDRVRVRVDLEPGDFRNLEELRDALGFSTRAEAIAYAIRLVLWITREEARRHP